MCIRSCLCVCGTARCMKTPYGWDYMLMFRLTLQQIVETAVTPLLTTRKQIGRILLRDIIRFDSIHFWGTKSIPEWSTLFELPRGCKPRSCFVLSNRVGVPLSYKELDRLAGIDSGFLWQWRSGRGIISPQSPYPHPKTGSRKAT